jgi:hypothetical protein
MQITINQINAIANAIGAEYEAETVGMDFATRMSTGNSAARARVFARYPESVVDGYLASERQDDRNSAAASDTRGTF